MEKPTFEEDLTLGGELPLVSEHEKALYQQPISPKSVKEAKEEVPSEQPVDMLEGLKLEEMAPYLNGGGKEDKMLAGKIDAVERFWLKNRDAIVEGVLNSSDDVEVSDYVEGSYSNLRREFGERIKFFNDPKLEQRVRQLLKEKMVEHFEKNRFSLIKRAIENAPSLTSLFEVIKRFSQFDDYKEVYSREKLAGQFSDILALDKKLEELAISFQNQSAKLDSRELEKLTGEIREVCKDLPLSLDIKKQVTERLLQKVTKLSAQGLPTQAKKSWFSRTTSRVGKFFRRSS